MKDPYNNFYSTYQVNLPNLCVVLIYAANIYVVKLLYFCDVLPLKVLIFQRVSVTKMNELCPFASKNNEINRN